MRSGGGAMSSGSGGVRAWIKSAFGLLIFTSMPVLFYFHLGPVLWADFSLERDRLVPISEARVSAWCKPAPIIFSKCDVRIEVDGRPEPVRFEFTAMSGYLGKYPAVALRSRVFAFLVLFGGSVWLPAFLVWVNVCDWLKDWEQAAAGSPPSATRTVRASPRQAGSVVQVSSFDRCTR